MMNVEQRQLYQRIQAFCLDEPNVELPFSLRLANENTWTIDYAQRVIDEYKKFVFLAVVADHFVTPSDAVDQAWHLHLLYTRSYWEEFCPNILQMPLHHIPTQGGRHEGDKHVHCYRQTLESYEHFFGIQPPAEIWVSPHVRFRSERHVRVNLEQHWITRRIQFNFVQWLFDRRFLGVLPLVIAVLLTGCTEIRNPFNLVGSDFLSLYLQLGVASLGVSLWLRSRLRRSTPASATSAPQLNVEEMAYLANGDERVINLAIVNLVHQGCVKPIPETRSVAVQTPLPAQANAIDRSVAHLIQEHQTIQQVQKQALNVPGITSSIEAMRDRLQNLGLLMTQQQANQVRWISALPIWALLLFGLTKIAVGISRGKPVGFLVVLCVITGIIGLWFLQKPRRTQDGDRVLRHLKSQYCNSPDVPIGFALLGTEVLVGGALQDLRHVFSPPNTGGGSDGGSSGCSGSSCGGSSCGGGGCGGCGG